MHNEMTFQTNKHLPHRMTELFAKFDISPYFFKTHNPFPALLTKMSTTDFIEIIVAEGSCLYSLKNIYQSYCIISSAMKSSRALSRCGSLFVCLLLGIPLKNISLIYADVNV